MQISHAFFLGRSAPKDSKDGLWRRDSVLTIGNFVDTPIENFGQSTSIILFAVQVYLARYEFPSKSWNCQVNGGFEKESTATLLRLFYYSGKIYFNWLQKRFSTCWFLLKVN